MHTRFKEENASTIIYPCCREERETLCEREPDLALVVPVLATPWGWERGPARDNLRARLYPCLAVDIKKKLKIAAS